MAAIQHGIDQTRKAYGPGAVAARASVLARNVHAFEILVGPYAVAHLRITQAIGEAGGELPSDGVHIYLTDTLESPDAAPPGRLPLSLRRLGDEHRRAQAVKKETRVLVCMGNPPYSRAAFAAHEGSDDPEARRARLLGELYTRVRGRTIFSHIASLYNEYVYFWRWALWKVFESTGGPGVLSFISASSYLSGPGFMGMREVMRQTFDDRWIIDLEGSDGPRKTENVFAIRTSVAIAVGVRYGKPQPGTPTVVHYARLTGTRAGKLDRLATVERFEDIEWARCSDEWTDSLLPSSRGEFLKWPLATDMFPWQYPGLMSGRTWPVATSRTTLLSRRRRLVATPAGTLRSAIFADKKHGKTSATRVVTTSPAPASSETVQELQPSSPEPPTVRFGYRSFDRQWLILNPRVIDLPRPAFWAIHSDRQVYLGSLLTGTVGLGPTFTASAYVPDKHFFRGSYGGKDFIPLWRDASAKEPNVTKGVLTVLAHEYRRAVSPEDLFAYAYGIFANESYSLRFAQELGSSSPRLPLTRDPKLFERVRSLGRRLLVLHTFGERFGPADSGMMTPAQGVAMAGQSIPTSASDYPETFRWDDTTETLHVGKGTLRRLVVRSGNTKSPGFAFYIRGWAIGCECRQASDLATSTALFQNDGQPNSPRSSSNFSGLWSKRRFYVLTSMPR